MQALTAAHHRLIDQAAALVSPASRAVFLMHARSMLDGERELSHARLVNLLCDVLGRFGVAVGPAFFRSAPQPRQPSMPRQPSISKRARFAAPKTVARSMS